MNRRAAGLAWGRADYKRPLDLAVLAVTHLPFLPLWLLLWLAVAAAVKLGDGGPVFYTQPRVGRNGRVFTIRKFRTMSDSRITPVGHFLRYTALDELPQVLNILTGDMSLVGPRPEQPELHARFCERYRGWPRRLAVPPGLTGLAQVRGPYDMSPRDKLGYDLEYIERMGLWLDLRLLAASVLKSLTARWDRPGQER